MVRNDHIKHMLDKGGNYYVKADLYEDDEEDEEDEGDGGSAPDTGEEVVERV